MPTMKATTFDALSRLNHWLIAVGMIGMIGFGLYLENAEIAREAKGQLMGLHKAFGVVFLIFALWRVGYRVLQGFPAPVGPMPNWQELAMKLVHWGLLVAVLAMPISGVLMSVYGGRAVEVFGLFTIPAQEKVEAISSAAHLAHGLGANIAIALILVHVAAALKHHLIDRDATLLRMLGRGAAGQDA